jgi:hypothetical protein
MKKYIIVLLLAFIPKFNFSQNKFEYNHSYGLSICFGIKNNYFNFNPQFQYNAEIDYLIGNDFSFSFSLYPTIGLFDAYFDESHFAIPFGFQINLGNAASKYSLSNQGFLYMLDFMIPRKHLKTVAKLTAYKFALFLA